GSAVTAQLAVPNTVNVAPGSSQGPGSNQAAVPSPVAPMSNSVPSQMVPSPAGGYAPSPSSSQVVPSPAGSFLGRTPGTMGAPSPGSTLSTPGNVGGATPSPAARSQSDDQAYLEKLKQLSKYIDPLRRMIARIDKDENRKKELSKMNNLLDILSDPNRRCSMETLLKCEQVLERMELKEKIVRSLVAGRLQAEGFGAAAPAPRAPEQSLCQPLLDAVASHLKSPMFNHTLHRVFGPAITTLLGPSPRGACVSPPAKRRRVPEEGLEIPDLLQGEIAHLDQRFKVQLDPSQHTGSRTVHLICQLDDKNLPCVPPITVAVPENYPSRPPQCNASRDQYDSTQFLRNILQSLDMHLDKMPEKYSVTSLLDTWEMCVRQACSLPDTITAISRD
ncbi:positive cofactor 2, subunit of a RNA polymerase II multiprotein coactivator, putative, partial [Ixodes scapularis]